MHGIPGVPVDVYAGGNLAIPAFQPLTTAGPPATAAARVDAAVITQTLAVPSGANVSVVANVEGGTPNLEAFANDLSPVVGGPSRVTVRHTANAPAVDIAVDGTVAIPGLAPGTENSAVLPAGTYDFAVQVGGTTVIPLDGTVIPAGKNVIAYAVGDATATPSTLTAVVQVLDVPVEMAPVMEAPAPVMASPRMTG